LADCPLFSVIIPVHDRAGSILPTLRSVAGQTYGDWECLVIDDGSRDGARLRGVVEGMRDPRFRLIRRANGGGGAARNTGIDAARGAWLAFLDSDDLFHPDKLAAMAACLPGDPKIALYSPVLVDRGVGRMWIRPDRGIAPGEDVREYLFAENQCIQTSTIVIARESAARTRFDPDLPKGQDLDFCVRLARDGVRFRMIERPLATWLDVGTIGRTSHVAGHEAPLAWLGRTGHLLSPRARLGYRATVLAYYLARERPFTAARDLLRAWALGRVPARIIARNAMRAFVPARTYRRMVDAFVARKGLRAAA